MSKAYETVAGKISKPTANILEFSGTEYYYIRNVDCESCICRKIDNFEIDLSNFKPKKMSLNLYVWELSDAGTPIQIVGRRYGISSKTKLMDTINYVETNVSAPKNLEKLEKADIAVSNLMICETVQDNHGIIGTINASVTINNK